MKTIFDHLRRHALERAGVFDYGKALGYSLARLRKLQWNTEFEKQMRLKFLMGAFRYIPLDKQKARGIDYDHLTSAMARLQHYKETGNMDVLPDIANLMMAEWDDPIHPKAHHGKAHDGSNAIGRM